MLDPLKIFKDVDTDSTVVLAVSGGSDSVALLLLASSWAMHSGVNLQVVTIDHGLRPEAAAEAGFVSGISEALNLPHITIAWEGLKPVSGLSNAARTARYQLLEEFALDIGARTILVGHTANDQAETILMRNARGGNNQQTRGMSGIASHIKLPSRTKLLRPLIEYNRQQLRTYLIEANQSWIEDPSNFDEAYERVRIRNRLGNDDKKISELCRFAKASGYLRRYVSEEAASILSTELKMSQGPVYEIDFSALEDKPAPVRNLVLQVMIAIAGGAEYFISYKSLEKLFVRRDETRFTLGRAVVETKNNCFKIYREKRSLPAIIIEPGEETLWDGRFLVRNDSASPYFCGPVSFEQMQELEQARGGKFNIRPRAVLGGTPCLRGDGDDVILPFVKGFVMPNKVSISLCVRSIEYFCPEYDFALLKFVDALKTRMAKLGLVKYKGK